MENLLGESEAEAGKIKGEIKELRQGLVEEFEGEGKEEINARLMGDERFLALKERYEGVLRVKTDHEDFLRFYQEYLVLVESLEA